MEYAATTDFGTRSVEEYFTSCYRAIFELGGSSPSAKPVWVRCYCPLVKYPGQACRTLRRTCHARCARLFGPQRSTLAKARPDRPYPAELRPASHTATTSAISSASFRGAGPAQTPGVPGMGWVPMTGRCRTRRVSPPVPRRPAKERKTRNLPDHVNRTRALGQEHDGLRREVDGKLGPHCGDT